MAGALDIQDIEELNSASSSEIHRFTESDMLDSYDDIIGIAADNSASGMSDAGTASSSSSDEQDSEDTEEDEGHEADNEYGDYHDDLIDEVIGKQLDRNLLTGHRIIIKISLCLIIPDLQIHQIYLPNLTFLLQRLLIIFLCISHNNYLKIWFGIQITTHNTAYQRRDNYDLIILTNYGP